MKITACMMVKNEEERLPACLDSLRGLVDEIVIIDTGSTDRTIEIARCYTDKIYHRPWENDFSIHRNQSLEAATGDWCLVIDADEVAVVDPAALRTFLGRVPAQFNAVSIEIHDIQHGARVLTFNSPRIFRRGKARYSGIVHNQPHVDGPGSAYCPSEIFHIQHHGYDLSPEKMQAKRERTVGLLKRRLEVDPADHPANFYLCQIYASMGASDSARDAGRRYVDAYKEHPDFNESIYYTMFLLAREAKDKEDARAWLDAGELRLFGDIDLTFARFLMAFDGQDGDGIERACLDYLTAYDDMTHHPVKRQNRFIYHYNTVDLSRVLFCLSCMRVKEAMQSVSKFQAATALCQADVRDKLREAASKEYATNGLSLSFGGQENEL